MRFEFDQKMINDFVAGSTVKIGSTHSNYDSETVLNSDSQQALSGDFSQ